MDPLSICASVWAIIEGSGAILKLCYHVRSGLRKVPWSLIRMIEEIRDLRNITEAIQSAVDAVSVEDDVGVSQRFLDAISGPLLDVKSELAALEMRILRVPIEDLVESRWKAFTQGLTWELREQETKEHLARLERCKASLSLAITSQNSVSLQNIERMTISFGTKLGQTVARIETATNIITKFEQGRREKNVINWISSAAPREPHAVATNLHQPGTGDWLHGCPEYQEWLHSSHQVFWLSGPPGAGKTMLFAHTVESFAGQNTDPQLFAFVYCDFRQNGAITDAQSSNTILGILLAQLCVQVKEFPTEMLDEYQRANPGEKVKTASPRPSTVIGAILQMSKQHRVTLFVDAVDEIEDSDDFLSALDTLTLGSQNIKIFTTSRIEVQLSSRLPGRTIRVDLGDRVSEMDQDISLYVSGKLEAGRKLAWLNPKIKDEITSTLSAKSSGMFRWAQCQLDSIARARTVKEVRRTLDSLPQGLEETYNHILSQVPPADEELFRKLLMWLAFSFLPLTLEQLWEAVAIEFGTLEIDDDSRLQSPQDLLSLGHSLISVTSDGHVRLAHLSVRDHLLSDSLRQSLNLSKFCLSPAESHHQLALDCLSYLSFSEFTQGPSTSDVSYCDRISRFPFARYCAMAWSYHLRAAQTPSVLPEDDVLNLLTVNFFSTKSHNQFMSWVQLINADIPFKWNIYPRHGTPLYYAASFGLEHIIRHLLSHGSEDQDINAPGSRFGGTALHAATIRHHISIMEMLLDAGADPAFADFNGVTPLHSAASQGNMSTIEVLLRYDGANLMSSRDLLAKKTPAEWAVLSGETEVAAFLNEREKESQEAAPISPSASVLSFADSGCGLQSSSRKSGVFDRGEVALWKPRQQEYFPDVYDKRSGLCSSILVGIEVDGKVEEISPGFSPVVSRNSSWGSTGAG